SLGHGAAAGDGTAERSCQKPHLPCLCLSTLCASTIDNRIRGSRNRERPLPPPCAPLSICVTERAGVYWKAPWIRIVLGKSYGCQQHQPHDRPKRRRQTAPTLEAVFHVRVCRPPETKFRFEASHHTLPFFAA